MTVVVVTPPPVKPSEPGLSAAAAAEALRRLGGDARSIDASIGWHRLELAPDRLARRLEGLRAAGAPRRQLAAGQRALEAMAARPTALRRQATYQRREVYTSAIGHLEQALRLVASGHPGFLLSVAMVSLEPPTRRLESAAVLDELAHQRGPFDDYFTEELLPELSRQQASELWVSLTFQQQAPAAFRLAVLAAEALPQMRRVLGGPLTACWQAAGFDLDRPPFHLFHHTWSGADEALAQLADLSLPDQSALMAAGPLAVSLDEAPWADYLAPTPVVPAALGRGCYWRRCAFCPDQMHPRHRACPTDRLEAWLHQVADRFPRGAMLHLTDSALPMEHLAQIAEVIARDRLPLRWHGFVRVERELADQDFCRHLARGGCALLQLGVESGSARLLELIGKGSDPELARAVLRSVAEAGIHNQAYLLFGLPGETEADREATIELVEAEADHIHAINPSLLNLPRRSPMHRRPARYGITELLSFHADTDLSLYDDFRCGDAHPRVEARRWLDQRFFKNAAVRAIGARLRTPFKANHLCFIEQEPPAT